MNPLENHLENRLNYPLGDSLPTPGTALVVAPGVKWVRMNLPFELNHINLWLLRDQLEGRAGWSVVDCCVSTHDAKAQWEQIFAHALDGLPILRVICTHMHPDHIGLAHWLCERWQAPLWMSATDHAVARIGVLAPDAFGGEPAAAFYAAHGLNDPTMMERIKERTRYFPTLVPQVPRQFRRMMDGEKLAIGDQQWQCIAGYGHAPEHIALYCAALKVLVAGDMVLPRISTNVSVYDQEPEANPLKLFLNSIDKLQSLDRQTLTLPAHGKPFTGLHERIRQLHVHHEERLREVLQACNVKPRCAADLLPLLFKRDLDLHQSTFAMGEAIAHLHALWFEGRLHRTQDANGLYRFKSC